MARRGRISISKIVSDLANDKYPPAKEDLYALSDLSRKQVEEFVAGWRNMSPARRLAIMTELGEIADDHFEVDFNAVARAALDDVDSGVRAAAIRNLWEDQGTDLIPRFLSTLTNDAAPEVRAAATTALGIYVYLGEMEEIPATKAKQVEDALLAVFNGSDTVEVRRRALEAVGFSGRPDVVAAIGKAYADGRELMKVSALFAMGRNLDKERWGDTILEELQNVNPKVRFEAARAAGELQLDEAVNALGDLAQDADPEIQEVSIWALGEIGGNEARRSLERRLKTADDDLAEVIEDALAEVEFMDELHSFDLLDFEDEEEENDRLN